MDKLLVLLFISLFFYGTISRRHGHGHEHKKDRIEGRTVDGGKKANEPPPPPPVVQKAEKFDLLWNRLGKNSNGEYLISTITGSRFSSTHHVDELKNRSSESIKKIHMTEAENNDFKNSPFINSLPPEVECLWIETKAKRVSPGLFDIVVVEEDGSLKTIGSINENIKRNRRKRDAEGNIFITVKQTLFPYIEKLTEAEKTKGCGATYPRCSPIECQVTTKDCKTETPECTILAQPSCTVITSQACSASCETCNITQPVCYAVPKPCSVSQGRNCQVTPPECKVETEQACTTIRPPCTTYQPPCTATTFSSSDGTNCVDPKCIDLDECKPKTIPGSNTLSWEHCIKEEICLSPKYCTSKYVVCPAPETFCPPETTQCSVPRITCEKPKISCNDPQVSCPPPTVKCTAPVVSCASPLVRCPEVVATCTNAEYSCPTPKVSCPPPEATCNPPPPCELPPVPLPPPCPAPPGACEECQCIRLTRRDDWKMETCHCGAQCHFLCKIA